ncbi:esterase [Halobacillus andaensis]|uniref:Esterase n=1 Tax=Halobacillus andaensis TaxID=1176239 RepID=A0A917EWX7_HALAA|nr:alpha/beta hydrolase [Halobacillus andaensis]MBP2005680.1 acetyl esterase/lipase [Halobacillus andaensis]GGF26825.1 esterase [Halobacillus andaensis]
MESIRSKQFKIILKLAGKKIFWRKSGEMLKEGIATRRLLNHEPPQKLRDNFSIKKVEMNGHYYYEMKPLKPENDLHIFYTHGGGYVHKITRQHWKFLGRLADKLRCTITIPLYPLAPEHTYQQTFDFVYALYEQVVNKVEDPSNLVFMGDSAGGGLALALAQLLHEKQAPQPGKIILISPWLDLHLSNPEVEAIEKYDPFLTRTGVIEAGKMYAGDADRSLYLLSPINGDVTGLGEISIFMGSHDILAPDARKFVKKAKEQGKEIDYHEAQHMIHVYPIFNFPEARAALQQIISKIHSS